MVGFGPCWVDVSGGTAIAARMNPQAAAKEWIPLDYFEGLRRTRLPNLRDLISVDGRPGIYTRLGINYADRPACARAP